MAVTTATLGASPRARRPALLAFRTAVLRKPGRVVGLAIIVLFALMAVAGPWLYGRLEIDPDAVYAPPSAKHWLGTDFAGSDVLQEIIVGARYVLGTAALAALITAVLGTGIGLGGGLRPGVADRGPLRVTHLLLPPPPL